MQAIGLPLWVQISTALLTPVVAVAAGVIAFMQWRTAERKRKMDLFDKRYDLYNKLKKELIAAGYFKYDNPAYDWNDLISAINELPFLFGPWVIVYREELFKAFFRLQRCNKSRLEGTGISREEERNVRDDFAKFIVEMPQVFWKDMHIT